MKGKRKRNAAAWSASDHAVRDEQKQERQRRRIEKLEQRQQEKEKEATETTAPAEHRSTADQGEKQQAQQPDHNGDDNKKLGARERRRATLTHDTREKRDTMKLRLHLTKTRREISEVKGRLTAWDPVAEDERQKQKEAAAEAEAAAIAEAESALAEGQDPPKKKRKGRKGPESWKLKGAARPASQVYDFDTRYVDPYIEAHKEAAERAKRSVNVLALCKGRIAAAAPSPTAAAVARDYLGLLMQLGHLSEEARQYKSAREAWLECVELEGESVEEPMTTARECLVRMYTGLQRHGAVVRLGEKLTRDGSCWVRYSLALSSFVLKKDSTEEYMLQAIKSNPLCAFYIAYSDTFANVMEYTEELEDAEDEPQTSLEEAIEYCSGASQLWSASGAAESLRDTVRQACSGRYSQISDSDMDWNERLSKIEADYDARNGTAEAHEEEETAEEDELSSKPPDVRMFAGMFRTAMEMLQESGELLTASATKEIDGQVII